MPDDNKTTNINPASPQDTPVVGQTPSPPPAPPTDQSQPTDTPPPATDSTVPPPPPIVEEQPADTAAPPSQDSDIPPVVTTGEKPKGRVGKKTIATILGILFLVGGISAGVILVQRQQEIREKAALAEPCNVCRNGLCTSQGVSPPLCSPMLNECPTPGSRSGCPQPATTPTPVPTRAAATPTPTPAPTGDGGPGQCGRVTQIGRNPNSVQLTLTNEMINECKNICSGTDSTPWIDIYEYQCDEIGLTGGCQDNGRKVKTRATAGTYSTSEPTCGTVQIDAGCFNIYGSYGSVAYASKAAPKPCVTTTPPTQPPGLSARCLNVQAYDTDWNKITDLSTLKAGDTVRFTVSGTTTSGNIDKARFRINTPTWRTAVTTKRPGTNEFYDEYTIPEGITTFTINAQLHHTNPDIGWF